MDDLFDKKPQNEPLAARMRPRNLDEYVGQEHIVGKGRLLRRAIQADRLSSVIFYGPPGCGKTTLARVIAAHTKSDFLTLNAVLTGVAQIRDAIKSASDARKFHDKKTILFVDEVHRWNKSQQDALLPWVENGTFILIGATTENPFFEVNRALVSRSRVFQLVPLTSNDLLKAANQALSDRERGYGKWRIRFEDGALEHLVETANGDARSLLNALELAVETSPENWPPPDDSEIYISKSAAEESIQKKVVLYDKDGDYHYDTISAFIKSLRGRDPDAALYWLARMVAAGESPNFIFRRMMISACEDTGLADPTAICVVESCAAAFDRIGLPEGRYHLAHAALYLATCPKSNSSMGFFDALSSVQKERTEVPNHLKDASRDGEQFGHGEGYMYPHAYRDHWTAQQYLPDVLVGRVFFHPSEQGYEKSIAADVLSRRELQLAAMWERGEGEFVAFSEGGEKNATKHRVTKENLDEKRISLAAMKSGDGEKLRQSEENLTYSPKDPDFEDWQRRTDENASEILRQLRDTILDGAKILRHHCNLVANADNGVFLWELVRRSPEGVVAGLCSNPAKKKVLDFYAETVRELQRPFLAAGDFLTMDADDFLAKPLAREIKFDKAFFATRLKSISEARTLAEKWTEINEKSDVLQAANFYAFAKIAKKSANPAEIFTPFFNDAALAERFLQAEREFFDGRDEDLRYAAEDFAAEFAKCGFSAKFMQRDFDFKFRLDAKWLDGYFAGENSFVKSLRETFAAAEIAAIKAEIAKVLKTRLHFTIRTTYAFFALGHEK